MESNTEYEVTDSGWFYNSEAGVRVKFKNSTSKQVYPNAVVKKRTAVQEKQESGQNQQQANVETIQSVSNEWKRVIGCLGVGSFFFLVGVAAIVGFTITISNWMFYVAGVCSMIYLVSRIGVSYYLYKDAKIIAYHSEDDAGVVRMSGGQWKPRPVFWGVISLIMPPFAEYGPVTAYLFRRHKQIGTP